MALTADQIYILNTHLGKPGADVQLGTMLNSAFTIAASEITLTSGKILIGSVANVGAAQTMGGDATISTTGTLTIANSAVTGAKMAALASGNLLVGSAGNVATSVAMSGDATIVASGALTIGAGAVTKTKLAAGVQPAYMVVYAGKTAMSGTGQDITVTGAVAGDICLAQINTIDSNSRTIVTSITATDKITVTYSGAAGTGGNVSWQVLRATS